MDYVVKGGETIYDVCMNANGSIYAIDENLDLNGLATYTPVLADGRVLQVSDVVRNNAAVSVMQEHPLNSLSIPTADLEQQFDDLDILLDIDPDPSQTYFITSEDNYFVTKDNLLLTVQSA